MKQQNEKSDDLFGSIFESSEMQYPSFQELSDIMDSKEFNDIF
jgi:hypothetical protein